MALSMAIYPPFNKKLVNFGLPAKKLQARMLTYRKLTSGILRMPMHLSSGRVTLPPGQFHPHEFFPQSDLQR